MWAGHPSQRRTMSFVESVYYWQRMRDDIECYVQTCLVCQQDKVEQQQPIGLLEPLPVAEHPWESVTMDFITCLPRLHNQGSRQAIQPTDNGNPYVDLTINNKTARAMVDIGATHNFVTEAAAKRLELKLAPTNSRVKTVNAEVQNACGAANGVGVKLGAWEGMANFTVTAMDIFDIILGQELT
uniref:Uncharacterized protein LOC104220599 n=1 Tax=Nicotiana sylvestris TaxID=4096 RepID=A0A1U7W6B0_NICSY|nr:PREDICTED: uncharacterized protein LOC104220599 [Nicotiana sylvestris]